MSKVRQASHDMAAAFSGGGYAAAAASRVVPVRPAVGVLKPEETHGTVHGAAAAVSSTLLAAQAQSHLPAVKRPRFADRPASPPAIPVELQCDGKFCCPVRAWRWCVL